MKKLTLSTLLAVSSCFAVLGFTQANAAPTIDATPTQTATQTSTAYADGEHSHKDGERHQGKRGGHKLLEQLNLSDVQKTQIKALREAKRTAYQAERQDGVKPTQAECQARRAQMHADMATILTPEQKVQFDKLMAERAAKHDAYKANRTS